MAYVCSSRIFCLDVTVGSSRLLNFEPGTTSVEVTIPVVDDDLLEETERFRVILFEPSFGVIDPNLAIATVFIADNDGM
jgi:hypothetical protein